MNVQSESVSLAPVGEERSLAARPSRLASIDQLRGYAFFGMVLVNYLGDFESMPWQFKHHNTGMSYADTIAPLFIFVAGMGFRASFTRRVGKDGLVQTLAAAFRRYLILVLIGIVIYGPAPGNWPYWWDALVDIGFGGILALPVMARGAGVRAGLAGVYLAVYQALYSWTGYGGWVMAHSIDGGPLGIMPWASILLLGTVAYDVIACGRRDRLVWGCIGWGVALCAAGWVLGMEWPGLKTAWPFSQRGMSVPYPLFAAGLCFLTYLPFYFICDVAGLRIPHLTLLGMNPLVLYLVQQALGDIHGALVVPENSGPALAVAGFVVFYLICYAVARKLHNDKVVIKL